MLGYLGINVPDLRAAKSYYAAIMPLLGFEKFANTDDEFAYRPAGGKRNVSVLLPGNRESQVLAEPPQSWPDQIDRMPDTFEPPQPRPAPVTVGVQRGSH
jgi:hypothetical protein